MPAPPCNPEAALPPSPHLTDDLHKLLADLKELQLRHQQRLDAYRDAEGEVIEAQRAAYEEERESTAIEASDRLDTVIHRLEQLAAAPGRLPAPPAAPAPRRTR
ncbi:hypothetical protein AB0B15_11895 [Streptomyces sp. NPDC045456]|uniref:hypothetical protein n=1 Tax=Streptomyces sp. NPDC045456 TaxID=3155254 RepID=UPI0033C82939